MTDYRLPENRNEYFTALYSMNLNYGVMPGLVYLYMPELSKRLHWNAEQKLWFAFLNGNTQNPITSLRIFEQFPDVPKDAVEVGKLEDWFNSNWATLSFDQDRRHQKRDLPAAVGSYAQLVRDYGSQESLLTGTFSELWDMVTKQFYSFGRLAAFSYLEYVKIMGFGANCDNLFWEDKSGSKSHRNGMLFLLGHDNLVWDKRQHNGFDGSYDFKKMVPWLNTQANAYLKKYQQSLLGHTDAGYFTLESQLCQFKNGFFRRRYPGVYSDMAWDRIRWYEDRGLGEVTRIFKQIREDRLPDWLREECEDPVVLRNKKASVFADTGIPFRAEHFM